MFSVRSFPRLDKTYEIYDGMLHIKPLFGSLYSETIDISKATISTKSGVPFGAVTVSIPGRSMVCCDGLLNPNSLAQALWDEQKKETSGVASSSSHNSRSEKLDMDNASHVLFMPGIDKNLSNFLHAVAPTIQHSQRNWTVSDGAIISSSDELFNLKYRRMTEGWYHHMQGGSMDDQYDAVQRAAFAESAEFSLKSPVNGIIKFKEGFYVDDYYKNIISSEFGNSDISFFKFGFAFQMLTDSSSEVSPYAFYKPWFDCVERSRSWIHKALKPDDYYGNPNWYSIIERTRESFQYSSCPIMKKSDYVDWLRKSWGDDPGRPEWLR